MVLSVLLTKYTSCIAAIVASMHIAVRLYNGSIKVSDNGKMNKANPVTLFNVLCMDSSSFLRTKTYPYRTVIMGESSFDLVISYCGDKHVRNLMDVISFPIGQFYGFPKTAPRYDDMVGNGYFQFRLI